MKKVTKAIIPAAGLGTRFLPITKAIPKPMLPVLDKPTIQYIAEELDAVGITDILIIISEGSDTIINHFTENKALEERLLQDGKTKLLEIAKNTHKFNVSFAVQKQLNGLGGALLCAEEFLKGEPFALLLGDELMYAKEGQVSCIKKLVDVYEKTGKHVLATMQVFGDDVSKYGNIGIRKDYGDYVEISAVIEKPSLTEALSNDAIMGRYVLDASILDHLKKLKMKGSEIYLTDVFDNLGKKGEVLAVNFEDTRYDVGDKLGFIKANVEFALRSNEIGEDVKQYIKDLAKTL